MQKQRGVTLFGMLMVAVIIILLALLGLKVTPAYIEYFAVKKDVTSVVASGEAKGTVADIRRSFDRHAQIDDVSVVSGADLDITKDGNDVVIAFAYPKKIPLFSNISLYIDFAGSSAH